MKNHAMSYAFSRYINRVGKREEKEETKKPQHTNKEAETKPQVSFVFRDVEGNSYEAPLLEGVKKHTYDYSKLFNQNGHKYYYDESGNRISKLGIDVSKYQQTVNWAKVKASGVEFVMIRLGFRAYGESGALQEDPLYRSHVEGALKEGLDVGVYFFSQAITEEEVLQEAQFVLERITPYSIHYPIVFDTEEIKNDTARTDHLTGEEYTRLCITFCDFIKEAGYDTMIYANMKWLAFTLGLSKLDEYDLWYADYEATPQIPYEYRMWQYTESGKVDGIEGNVDMNVYIP